MLVSHVLGTAWQREVSTYSNQSQNWCRQLALSFPLTFFSSHPPPVCPQQP